MKKLSGLAVVALVAGVFFWSSPDSMAQGCDHGGNHTIQVHPNSDGTVNLTYRGGPGDAVRVCAGDSVSWVLTGSNRTFFVNFFSGAPFAGATMRGNNSRLTITIDAAPGGYNYDIGMDGSEGGDPIIIVD